MGTAAFALHIDAAIVFGEDLFDFFVGNEQ